LLQQGRSVNPLEIYVPLADVYAQFGIGSLNMDAEIERQLATGFVLELRGVGYDFGFVNDDTLSRVASVQAGVLRAGTAAYSVVIVANVHFMPPKSLEVLRQFVQEGDCIIFAGRRPAEALGLKDHGSRTARLTSALDALWARFRDVGQRQSRVDCSRSSCWHGCRVCYRQTSKASRSATRVMRRGGS